LEDGIAPGGTYRNLDSARQRVHWHDGVSDAARLLLCDAQTSGGLLMSVPHDKLDLLLKELEDGGVPGAAIVGEVIEDGTGRIEVLP
jgi:selenide,water dikinase